MINAEKGKIKWGSKKCKGPGRFVSGERAKEDPTVRVIFKQRPTGGEEVKPGDIQRNDIPGRENSLCKGPEAGAAQSIRTTESPAWLERNGGQGR